MEINVARISKFEGVKEPFDITDSSSYYEIEFCGEKLRTIPPIRVSGYAINYEGKIKLEIKIFSKVERTCSRCLEHFVENIEIDTDLIFVNNAEACKDDEYLFKGESIEILDLVLGEIAAALTMKPLCGNDCKGLCPICGKNKNTDNCECKNDVIDSRLQILSKLLDTEQGGV